MSSEKQVYIVENPENDGKKPGGFTMRNMGPEDIVVHPGEKIPADWVHPHTLETLMRDGHMEYVEEEVKKPKKAKKKASKKSAKKQKETFTDEMRQEHCIFPEVTLEELSDDEISELLAEIADKSEVAIPELSTKEEKIEFLSSGVSE